MSAMMQILGQTLGAQDVEQIGSRLGVDGATAQKAIALSIPVLLEALSRNAAHPEGARALENAVERDHDGTILDDLGSLLSGGGSGGEAILPHVLGSRQQNVQERIGRASGLDAAAVGQLLAMLAPIVLGALGRARQQGDGDLGSILGGARAQVQRQAPQATDILSGILDANHDGSALDDVARMGISVLGGLFNRK